MAEPTLAGRVAIVTGASRGLGRAIADAYLGAGALVHETAREIDGVDLRNPAGARRIVASAIERFGRVDVLVSNAGVLGPLGRHEDADDAAWAETLTVNLLAPARLFRAVLPHFRTRGYGKIVQLSGGGATAAMPHHSAYAASKAGVVRLVETIAAETAGEGIDVNALAPGALDTRMLDELLAAGPERVGAEQYARAVERRASGGADLGEAAELAVFLGSAASDGITGRLISAVWDPWRSLGGHRTELEASDVYTLRRIVPEDRGLNWS